MRRRGGALRSVLFAAMVASGGVGLATAPARADTPTLSYVTMVSSGGDFVGQGLQALFSTGSGDSVTVSGTTTEVDVQVSNARDSFTLDLAAPPGAELADGSYVGATRTPFRNAGTPGIDVYGDGRGCNTTTGAFTVRDIGFSGGAVSRLSLDYLEHCEGGTASLFGHIELGAPAPTGALVAPGLLGFPATYPGGASAVAPVYVVAPAGRSVAVTSAAVTGADSASFAVRSDACSGQTLAAGASCAVYVRFQPTTSGDHAAALHLVTATGSVDVPLTGHGTAGHTEFSYTGDAGDYIGNGQSETYTPAADTVSVSGVASHVAMGVSGADGTYWSFDVAPASGDILAAGSTYQATRYPFQGSGPGLNLDGNGRGCNMLTASFTVKQAPFDASSGALQSIDLTFVQHCEGATPALHGHIAWKVLANGEQRDPAQLPYPTAPAGETVKPAPTPAAPTTTAPTTAAPTTTAPTTAAPSATPVAPAGPAPVTPAAPQANPTPAPATTIYVTQPIVYVTAPARPATPVAPARPRLGARAQASASAANTVAGRARLVTVLLRNTGNGPVHVGGTSLRGAAEHSWRVIGGCSGALAPGHTCLLRLAFQPRHRGSQPAELVVTVPGAGTERVTLSGLAV